MAYINIADWNYDQVSEWLRGLEDAVHPYIHSFVYGKIDGIKLLHITSSDLIKLDVIIIGHQEIILQAVNLLKSLHYHLHQENAQLLALRLCSKARSIYNELCAINQPDVVNVHNADDTDSKTKRNEKASTGTISAIADVLASVKALVGWLHKAPFSGIPEYDDLKSRFIDLGISLATIAQRGAFADQQCSIIRDCCFHLAQIADRIIQESKDPMILQPACLEVTTLKKRMEDNWGISLFSSYHGIHQISVLRALSPAHNSGKLMAGDQIIQVNYQIVVGWTSVKVTHLMQENPSEVILTMKKCPRHASTNSNIYFKPFRLPSKKRTYSPWATNGFSANRFDLQSIPNLQFIKSFDGKTAVQRVVSTEPHNISISPPPSNPTTGSGQSLEVSDSDANMTTQSDSESDLSDDAFISDSELCGAPSSLSVRLFSSRPRAHPQRRATIPGATMRPTMHYEQIVRDRCNQKEAILPASSCLGFKVVGGQDTNVIDGTNDQRGDSAAPSEEMPFIDEPAEIYQSNSTCSIVDRKGFIDRANLPEPSPLTPADEPLTRLSDAPVMTSSMKRSRFRLDKTVSSPIYDDYEPRNRTFFNSCSLAVDKLKIGKTLSSFDEADKESSDKLEIVENMPSVDDDAELSPAISLAEATYVNQNSTLERAPADYFQHPLIRGNRRISCRELGQGDQQGWLYRRKEHKGFLLPHRWVKRWFILNKSILYGYKDCDSLKADSLIYLPGFHVSPASEVKVKRFAFKIFHSRGGATFYFACESAEVRSRWMSQMGLSAITSTMSRSSPPLTSGDAYYSETDDELDDKHFFKSSSNSRNSNHSNCNSSKKSCSNSSPGGGYFSLGKSQPLKFLQSSKAALSNPVPTSNFRSYVRVRDGPNSVQPNVPNSPNVTSGMSKLRVKDGSVTLGKDVRRKNSIRERLMYLPNLTMDRRKSSQKQSPEVGLSNPKRICTTSKSEMSLVQTAAGAPPAKIPHSQSIEPMVPQSGFLNPVMCSSESPILQDQPNDTVISETGSSVSPGGLCDVKSDELSSIEVFSHFKGNQDASGIKLKCASQYFPVTLGKDMKETMQATFEMNLSSSPVGRSPVVPSKLPRHSISQHCESPKVRPKVPPRTKFLSPSERVLPSHSEELGSPISRISRTNQPPNLVISEVSDDGDSPKTPCKPTMGVAMIGKQRKTPPTSISPKEILHQYPGMEYPPTFEAESYSLSSQRGSHYSQEAYARQMKSVQNLHHPSDNYVNISDSIEDYKGLHHQIYVTSPLSKQDVSPISSFGRPPLTPQNSFQSRAPLPQSSFQRRPSPPTSLYTKRVSTSSFHAQDVSPQNSFRQNDISHQSLFHGQNISPQDSLNGRTVLPKRKPET